MTSLAGAVSADDESNDTSDTKPLRGIAENKAVRGQVGYTSLDLKQPWCDPLCGLGQRYTDLKFVSNSCNYSVLSILGYYNVFI